jgi:hypothetical protein
LNSGNKYYPIFLVHYPIVFRNFRRKFCSR